MQASKSMGLKFEPQQPQLITREGFLRYVDKMLNAAELSWITTEVRSFDWAVINLDKKQFRKELRNVFFKKAYVGIFYPEAKKTEYLSFKILQ